MLSNTLSAPAPGDDWQAASDAARAYECCFPHCLKGGHDPATDPATWSHEIIVDRLGECLDVSITIQGGEFRGSLEFEGERWEMTTKAMFAEECDYFADAARLMKSYGAMLESVKSGGPGQVYAARYVRSQITYDTLTERLHIDGGRARRLWLGIDPYLASEIIVFADLPGFTTGFFAAYDDGEALAVAA